MHITHSLCSRLLKICTFKKNYFICNINVNYFSSFPNKEGNVCCRHECLEPVYGRCKDGCDFGFKVRPFFCKTHFEDHFNDTVAHESVVFHYDALGHSYSEVCYRPFDLKPPQLKCISCCSCILKTGWKIVDLIDLKRSSPLMNLVMSCWSA